MKVQFEMIYGGCRVYNKKDKNGNKLDEKQTQYNLLSLNKENNFVENKIFFMDGDNPLNVQAKALDSVKATLDMTPTSTFVTLVDIKG